MSSRHDDPPGGGRRVILWPDTFDSGCCGLAGNFGFERGHYDVSAACAERTQLAAGHTGRDGWHLAQLLERVTAAAARPGPG